jgi:hypothetical protein
MTTFPSREPTKVRPRVDFDPERFRKHIFAKGVDLTWAQCAECPCARSASDFTLDLSYSSASTETGEARPDCPLCDGRGYFWHSEQTIRAIVTSGSSKTDSFAVYGEYARGMVSITTLPEHLPAFGDRFEIVDSVIVFRETQTRTANAVEALRYPIQSRTLDLATGETVVRVLRLQFADANGLSAEANSLTEGEDFVVTEDGEIDFSLGDASGTAPAEGLRYSVSYYARPRYYVASHPHTHRDSTRRRKSTTEAPITLPIQVECSLEFMG